MVHFRGIIFLIIISINTTFSHALPTDSLREAYVEEYPDKFYIKPIFTIRALDLQLSSKSIPSKINFVPNGNAYFGLGAYVFNLGVEASLAIPRNARSIKRYGETEIFDFQSNIYAKKWGADVALQKYEGFYVGNPMAHFPGWELPEPYPQRNDLLVKNLSAHVFYIINHNRFSYRSAYNQADRQLRSGGSAIAGINFLDQEIRADSSLIPYDSREEFGLNNFDQANFFAFGFSGGYTYSFVYKYFYLNLSLTGGPVHLWNIYKEDGVTRIHTTISPLFQFRTALGYNSPKWFSGITVVSQTSNFPTDHIDIRRQFGNVKVFIGYRFKEVGVLKRSLF